MAAIRTSFDPLGPVILCKPSGVRKPYGYGALTDGDRGVAFKNALSNAVAGEKILFYDNCVSDVAPIKEGVRVVPLHGAVYTNTAGRPGISPDELDSTATAIVKSREASYYCKNPEFMSWDCNFATTRAADYGNTVYSQSGDQSLNVVGGLLTYTGESNIAGSAYMLASNYCLSSQRSMIVELADHNFPIGATYNDIIVGFGICTGDTLDDYFGAKLQRLESNPTGRVELVYTYGGFGGTATVGANLSEPLTFPCKLICVLNHGSLGLVVEESDGRQRQLLNLEINIDHWDMEDASVIAKLRPLLTWQSDTAQVTKILRWTETANGSLGRREHYPATYENGEPIQDGKGNYYITADNTNVTTLAVGEPVPNSPFMRNQSTTSLWNLDNYRLVKDTAKYVQSKDGRLFGCQQCKVLRDRRTGLDHLYTSEWNDGSDRIQIMHFQSYDNLLHGWHKITFEAVDISGVAQEPFDSFGFYDNDVTYYNGRWYLCGSIFGVDPFPAHTAFCLSGTSPTVFNTLEFIDDAIDEGTRFVRFNGVLYVATAYGPATYKIFDLTGVLVNSITLPHSNTYNHQCSIIPKIRGGRTNYLGITMGDISPTRQDFESAAGVAQVLAFGSDIFMSFGEYAGEEYTALPKR